MKKIFKKTNKNIFKLNENTTFYAPVTLKIDAMGSLHMWEGEGVPEHYSKYGWKMDGREADVYIQNDFEVENILNDLPEDERDHLKRGYHITTTNISDEYFNQN